MFNDVLTYGKSVMADTFIDPPFDLITSLTISVNQLYLKTELASHGFNGNLHIEETSLDQAMEMMKSATNDADFVFYTINYIALRNPYIKATIFEFLEGC